MKFIKATQLKDKPDATKLKFGQLFTDYMLEMNYENGQWGEPVISPYHDLVLAPESMILHYGQGIFEGAKAFRNDEGKIILFRLMDNLKRLNLSAERMCMPQMDTDKVMGYILELIDIERDWVPSSPETSLYLRPTMIATEKAVGVHASNSYKFFVILSPVGPYINGFNNPAKIYVEDTYTRAAVGGTGEAKCVGNYAGSILAAHKAKAKGYNEVLWLDAKDRQYIEEVGAMNVMFVVDGEIITPTLTGSILRGITRDSIIKMMRDIGYTVREERININDLIKWYDEGRVTEMFGCGTAAVVSPVGTLTYKDKVCVFNNGKSGPVARVAFDRLDDIRKLRVPDKYGWITVLGK
ncbi:MAG: branched-chain amino acid aminotransferase [Clostridia bacterium]|nr:branched-chain amino acid aminotransferase [Clostridia bacterium]MDD3832115.1 branched-chain amino acid aminotransferase [Clostridia bacterium]